MRLTTAGRSARAAKQRAVIVVALCVGLLAPMTGTAHAIGYQLIVEKTGSGEGTVYSTPQFETFTDPGINDVFSITTGPDGAQWFLNADPDASSVGRISHEGVVTTFPIAPLSRVYNPEPSTIVSGPDGNLWFTRYADDQIVRMTPAGDVTVFPSTLDRPGDLTVGPDDALWFTSTNSDYVEKIGRITTAGVVTVINSDAGGATTITTGPDENLWFGNFFGGAVTRMTTAGQETTFSDGNFSEVHDIVTGSDGAMWVGGAYAIARVAMDGTFTMYYDNAIQYVQAITAGTDGALWFTNDVGQVGRMTTAGELRSYEVSGVGISQGPTALWAAAGMHDRIVRITPDDGVECGEDCSSGYAPGQTVTLRAEVEPDSRFIGWTGACAGEETDECTVTMDASKTVGAEFAYAPTPRGCYAAGEIYNVIVGTSDDDVLVGTDGPDAICGGDGDDVIRGAAGDDVIYGNGGHDDIRGHGGMDWVKGNNGADSMSGDDGADFLRGGDGVDLVYGNDGADTVRGNEENDFVFGNAGSDQVLGGNGDDSLDGGADRDYCYGQGGIDTLVHCEPLPDE